MSFKIFHFHFQHHNSPIIGRHYLAALSAAEILSAPTVSPFPHNPSLSYP